MSVRSGVDGARAKPPEAARQSAERILISDPWPWRATPAHENGSAAGPQGRPLLHGGGERRVDRISDLRVCSGDGSFST
jgi:hypothetical protein